VPTLLSRTYTHYAAAVLFAYFGFKLLKEAREMTVRARALRLPRRAAVFLSVLLLTSMLAPLTTMPAFIPTASPCNF
jgi:putative Ca2+/H+ antiporter (TMEM165/GDT1 family)